MSWLGTGHFLDGFNFLSFRLERQEEDQHNSRKTEDSHHDGLCEVGAATDWLLCQCIQGAEAAGASPPIPSYRPFPPEREDRVPYHYSRTIHITDSEVLPAWKGYALAIYFRDTMAYLNCWSLTWFVMYRHQGAQGPPSSSFPIRHMQRPYCRLYG